MRGPLRTHRRREMKRRPTFRWFLRVTALVLVATLVSSIGASARSRAGGPPPGGDLTSGPSLRHGGAREAPDRFRLHLRGRSFEPAPGVERSDIETGRRNAIGDRVHYLVQMDPLPDAAERAALAQQGLHLL